MNCCLWWLNPFRRSRDDENDPGAGVDDSKLTTWMGYLVTFVGGGAIFKTLAERRIRSADKQAELEAKTAADEDAARKDFRNELRETIRQLYAEIAELRTAHADCQDNRMKDREELAYFRGQVELLTGQMAIVPKSMLHPIVPAGGGGA